MTTTHLNHFGFLSITGKDAMKFLQGYTTCDVNRLTGHQAGFGAICNIQGRMVTSFRIVKLDDGLLLRMHRDLVDKTLSFLGKYIVFSKAEMSDMSETYTCYGATGVIPGVLPENINDVELQDANIVVKVSASSPRYEIWATQALEITDEGLETDAWQQAEINDGYAWVGASNTEEYIPQMFNYHNIGGIDFEKGCYLGQEIIARLEYRGKLKQKLHRGESSDQVSSGDELLSEDGKAIGSVVNVAHRGNGYSILAVLQNPRDDPVQATIEGSEPVQFNPVDSALI
jgi:hypothetical protein